MDPTLLSKIRAFKEEEFYSEPMLGLISSPKSKLGINFKAFGWSKLWEKQNPNLLLNQYYRISASNPDPTS